MSPIPLNDSVKAFTNVVEAWNDYKPTPTKKENEELLTALYSFPPFAFKAFKANLCSYLKSHNVKKWSNYGGHFIATPVTDFPIHLYPVVKYSVKRMHDELEGSIRWATFYKRDSANGSILSVDGWRFETAEKLSSQTQSTRNSRSHCYSHVQRISKWNLDDDSGKGLFPLGCQIDSALVQAGFNENRPAFPLPCNSPAGLVATVMVSLYGADETNKILESYASKPNWLTEELKPILEV